MTHNLLVAAACGWVAYHQYAAEEFGLAVAITAIAALNLGFFVGMKLERWAGGKK